MSVIHLAPLTYIHVLDQTMNITRVIEGPQTVVLQNNESLARDVQTMVIVPPQHYCVILNPAREIVDGVAVKLRHGSKDIRFHGTPFALYPGEVLLEAVKRLPVVPPNHAIRLIASLDFTDDEGNKRYAGDRWQLLGPITYIPRKEVKVEATVAPTVLKELQALRLVSKQTFVDREDNPRPAGSEWLVTRPGAYVPDVYEEVVRVVDAVILNNDIALHVEALVSHQDQAGIRRTAGQQFLVTREISEYWIEAVEQRILKTTPRTVLTKRQFAVIENPVDVVNGVPVTRLGEKNLVVGPASFFLYPGESIPGFLAVGRKPGDVWLITGPREYVPPITIQIIEQRRAMLLVQNDGVYVRDTTKGSIRLVMGPQTYMLKATELLWEKPVSALMRECIKNGGGVATSSDVRKSAYFESYIDQEAVRRLSDSSHAITYRVPHNCCVQIANFSDKTARVVFGPDLVVLGPHEEFNILSLSAGKPKVEHGLKCLPLMLGPDFITDEIVVETADHARLSVRYAVNNHFKVEEMKKVGVHRLFSIPDFIGFACRMLASRVRGAVAQIGFDEFHRHSATVIYKAVFGNHDEMYFEQNGLAITSIDIQYINPVDTTMSDLLMRSVQMAIEISTKSVEAAAQHEAKREEQASKARIDRQGLINQSESEKARVQLLQLRAISAAVESTGQAKAEAQARAESLRIEGQAAITNAKLHVLACEIEQRSELDKLTAARESELAFLRQMTELEVHKLKEDAGIEAGRFHDTIKAISVETIKAIAVSGPEMQVKLLQSLGLKSTLIVDGKTPLSLFSTAQGLVAQRNLPIKQ